MAGAIPGGAGAAAACHPLHGCEFDPALGKHSAQAPTHLRGTRRGCRVALPGQLLQRLFGGGTIVAASPEHWRITLFEFPPLLERAFRPGAAAPPVRGPENVSGRTADE